jgi:hypothetical protein
MCRDYLNVGRIGIAGTMGRVDMATRLGEPDHGYLARIRRSVPRPRLSRKAVGAPADRRLLVIIFFDPFPTAPAAAAFVPPRAQAAHLIPVLAQWP